MHAHINPNLVLQTERRASPRPQARGRITRTQGCLQGLRTGSGPHLRRLRTKNRLTGRSRPVASAQYRAGPRLVLTRLPLLPQPVRRYAEFEVLALAAEDGAAA